MTYAVLGDPVSRSLSPAFQNAALELMEPGSRYVARRAVTRSCMVECLEELRSGVLAGANVTLPHKRVALELADYATAVALDAGAANTWWVRDREITAANTDVVGVRATLVACGVDAVRVVVLGAGGAARAVTVALRGLYTHLTVVNRTLEHASELASHSHQSAGAEVDHTAVEWGSHAARAAIARAALVVDATALAHRGADIAARAYAPLGLEAMAPGATVFSLSYGPGTRPLFDGVHDGVQCLDGLCMLLHQGARSLELWTGVTPPLVAMRDALARSAGVLPQSIPVWDGYRTESC